MLALKACRVNIRQMNGIMWPEWVSSNKTKKGSDEGGWPHRVGLLGGSFNPPHYGHVGISKHLKRLCALDAIAWLITPYNPLKDQSIYEPIESRIQKIEALIRDEEDIFVWDIEKNLKTAESVQTVTALQTNFPQTQFVWLMGADLLLQLPLWPTWEDFLHKIPIAVYPRPGYTEEAKKSLVALQYAHAFIDPKAASTLPSCTPPALVFLEGQEYDISSTALRKDQYAQ